MTTRFIALFSAALACGCGGAPNEPAACSVTGRLTVLTPGLPEADVLFVIDRSPAMAAYQARVDSELPQLAATLVASTPIELVAKWRFGVVGAGLAEGSVIRWFDGNDPDQLAALVHSDDSGSADVEPLETMYRALHDPLAENIGFLRTNAALILVFVSAGDDAGTADLSRYETWLTTPAERGGAKEDPNFVYVTVIAPTGTARLDAFAGSIKQEWKHDVAAPTWSPIEAPLVYQGIPACLNRIVGDAAAPDCVAVDRIPAVEGGFVQRVLPRCDSAAGGDCWRLVDEPRCSFLDGPAVRLDVVRTADLPWDTQTTIECSKPCE